MNESANEKGAAESSDAKPRDLTLPDSKVTVERTEEITASFARFGAVHHPVFDKMTPEHVTMFLEHSHEHERDNYKYKKSDRWFFLVYFMLVIGIFMFLTVYLLPNDRDLYMEILKLVGAVAVGGFGGYGVKAWLDQRRS